MTNRRLVVLYGSETGTAQDVAERLFRDGKRRHFDSNIHSLDDYNANELINEKLVIFVCSTCGQGDYPANMTKFWRFIMRRGLPTTSLMSLRFAVIGLGDSSYFRYNVVAKKLYKRLSQLGALAVIPLALGDDQHELGPDAMLDPCIRNLWSEILKFFPLPPQLSPIPDEELLPSKFRVEKLPVTKSTVSAPLINGYMPKDTHIVSLISNERVTTPDHFQDVRLLSFDATNSGISYQPGDVMVIRPENGVDTVDDFIKFMNLVPSEQFVLHPGDSSVQVPPELQSICSVEEVVRKHFDINSVPRRYFFEILAYFSQDPVEKEKLLELCSPEGQDERYDYCNRVRRSILETLQDFPIASSSVPFHYLFDLIPPIQPRSFSIASSPLKHRNVIQLIVAVVNYRTKIKKPRKGLCSNWLANLDPSTNRIRLPVAIRPGTIDFSLARDRPVICVGPGTGIAPLRSLIHDRAESGIADNVLFFGCRNSGKDFYFRDEWAKLSSENKLDVHTAFSRDQDHKVYVQHIIQEQYESLWRLIDESNAYFFVAGNATRMPTDVREALRSVIGRGGSMDEADAEAYITKLEQVRRYQIECWS